MAKMGYGYGSEFQLMRFLGHHREELNLLIQNATGHFEGIKWLDYPYSNGDNRNISGDDEFKGIECFSGIPDFKSIEDAWREFWPQSGSTMNWDGIFILDGEWYFVEAKANEREAFQTCNARERSSKVIDKALSATKQWLGIKNEIVWRKTNCYQLANRLAFACFCNLICHIPTKIMYVCFLNGYRDSGVDSVEKWQEIWKTEYDMLGISESELNGVLYHVYPNCRPNLFNVFKPEY